MATDGKHGLPKQHLHRPPHTYQAILLSKQCPIGSENHNRVSSQHKRPPSHCTSCTCSLLALVASVVTALGSCLKQENTNQFLPTTDFDAQTGQGVCLNRQPVNCYRLAHLSTLASAPASMHGWMTQRQNKLHTLMQGQSWQPRMAEAATHAPPEDMLVGSCETSCCTAEMVVKARIAVCCNNTGPKQPCLALPLALQHTRHGAIPEEDPADTLARAGKNSTGPQRELISSATQLY